MSKTFLSAAIAFSAFVLTAQAQTAHTLVITESGENLSAAFDGVPNFGTITPNGTQGDNWEFTLPSGYPFNNVGGTFFPPEPETLELTPLLVSIPIVNIVTIRNATTLNWVSDVPAI